MIEIQLHNSNLAIENHEIFQKNKEFEDKINTIEK